MNTLTSKTATIPRVTRREIASFSVEIHAQSFSFYTVPFEKPDVASHGVFHPSPPLAPRVEVLGVGTSVGPLQQSPLKLIPSTDSGVQRSHTAGGGANRRRPP